MKNMPKIDIPDDLMLCDDCGEEFDKSEMVSDKKTTDDVIRQYCKYCHALHMECE